MDKKIFFLAVYQAAYFAEIICAPRIDWYFRFLWALCILFIYALFSKAHTYEWVLEVKCSGGHTIPILYILQLRTIPAWGVTGTYLGRLSLQRAEQPPAHLWLLPTGRWALPSISAGAGKVSLPPWPHRLPSFPSLWLPIKFRPCTARSAITLLVWGSPPRVNRAWKCASAFLSFHLKKKKIIRTRTGFASPAELLTLRSGPRKVMYATWPLLFSVAYLTINYRSNISNSDGDLRDLQRSQSFLCIPI